MANKIRVALRWTEHFLAVMCLVFLTHFACFDLSVMMSGSMAPTLQPPDWIVTEKVSSPNRWDVLTFRNRDGMQVMKRVVGLPGETVTLPGVGDLRIDGRSVDVPDHLKFIRYLPCGNLANGNPVATKDGWYVLGDFQRDSLDSRYEGPVRPDQVVGKAWMIVRPVSRFGFVR